MAPSRASRLPLALRLLHWGAVLLVVASVASGVALDELPKGALREEARAVHYTLGCLLIAWTALRALARVASRLAAPGVDDLGARAARTVHRAMYALMIAAPLAGLLDRWARGREVRLLGGVELPAPFAVPGGKAWGEVHEALAWSLVALVVAHLAAVAWHHYVLRDDVLARIRLRG